MNSNSYIKKEEIIKKKTINACKEDMHNRKSNKRLYEWIFGRNKLRNGNEGSMTVEMSLLMPLILMVIILVIYISTFIYNRQAVTKTVEIACIYAGQMEHDGTEKIKFKIQKYLQQEEKNVLLGAKVTYNVKVDSMKITVEGNLTQDIPFSQITKVINGKSRMQFSVSKKANRLDPADILWKQKILKKVVKDKKK